MPRQKFCSVPGCLSTTELIKREQEEFLAVYCDRCEVQRPCRCPAPDIYTTRKETRTKFTSWCNAIGLKSPGYYINVCHKHFSAGCPSRSCPNPDVVEPAWERHVKDKNGDEANANRGKTVSKALKDTDDKKQDKKPVKRKGQPLTQTPKPAKMPVPQPDNGAIQPAGLQVMPPHILSSLLLQGCQKPTITPPQTMAITPMRAPIRIALPTEPLPRNSASTCITTTICNNNSSLLTSTNAHSRQCPAIVAVAPVSASAMAPVIVSPSTTTLPPQISLPQTPLPPSELTVQTILPTAPSFIPSLPTPPASSTESTSGEESSSATTLMSGMDAGIDFDVFESMADLPGAVISPDLDGSDDLDYEERVQRVVGPKRRSLSE